MNSNEKITFIQFYFDIKSGWNFPFCNYSDMNTVQCKNKLRLVIKGKGNWIKESRLKNSAAL